MNSYIPLDTVRIASPCSTSWDAMEGNERVRHCSECSLSVYNISEMTRQEAETLVSNAEGRLCIRMYQRADGTIITQDCPVGVQAFRLRVARKVRAISAAALTFFGGVLGVNTARATGEERMGKMVYQETETVVDTAVTSIPAPADTASVPDEIHHVMMGGMMAPPPPPTAADTVIKDLSEQPADLQIYEVMGEMAVAVEPTVDTVQRDDRPTMAGSGEGVIDYTSFPAGTIIQGAEPLQAVEPVPVNEQVCVLITPLPYMAAPDPIGPDPVDPDRVDSIAVVPIPVEQPLPVIDRPAVPGPDMR